MRRVLVTGVSGHVGARALAGLHSNYEVHAVVRTCPTNPKCGVIYHEIDFSRTWDTEILPDQIDAVIHLAQARNYRDFPNQALETFYVNTASTVALLDYARRAGAQQFILASTGGLYRPSEKVIDNQTPVDPPDGPLSYYFQTKLSAESLTLSYTKEMEVFILRPFFIYGPGQSEEKLISRLITSVQYGKKVHLAGEDGLIINPVHVDDVTELLSSLLKNKGPRIINVAGPDAVSIRQIAEQIGVLFECTPVFEKNESEPCKILADHSTVELIIGRKMIRFKDGLRSLLK